MRVFLSYHTTDRAIAIALKSAIETALPGTDVFLDQTHLRYGHLWQPALFRAIADAQAFLILVSNRLGDWQKLEYYEAHDRKARDDTFILLPIVSADPAKGPVANLPGLTQFHWIESTEPAAPEPLAKIVVALQSRELARPPEPWRTINPYRGLVALDEQDADFFFGRDRESEDIINRMIAKPGRLIALVGNSGVGKSSLVQAGLIGSLRRQRWPGGRRAWPDALKDSRAWAYVNMKPGADPIGALVSGFAALWFPDATDPQRIARRNEWAQLLHDRHAGLVDLIEATDQRFRDTLALAPPPRVFLFIDQGEELYSRTPTAERRRFSQIIADGLTKCSPRLIVMTSLRADYYGDLQANATLFALAEKVDVPPLEADALAMVLREPAGLLGVKCESDDLIDHVVSAAEGQPGALPLLADLFTDLWERMRVRGDGTLLVSDRREIFQVGTALSKRADQFLANNPDKVADVRRLFTLRLVHIPRQGEPVRQRWERDTRTEADYASKAEWSLVEELAGPDWRLLVTGERDGRATAEIAHEILLKTWGTLKRWHEEERDFLVWRGELVARREEHRAASKEGPRKQRQALLMGLPLDTAVVWLQARRNDIEPASRAFIEASAGASRAVQRRWNWLQGIVGLSVLLALFVVLARVLPTGIAIHGEDFALSAETQFWSFDRNATKAAALVGYDETKSVVKVWQLGRDPLREPILTLKAKAMKLSPDGRYLALLRDGFLHVVSTHGPSAAPAPVADLREPAYIRMNEPANRLAEPMSSVTPDAYFDLVRFSANGKWLTFLTPEGEILLVETSSTENRVLIAKHERVRILEGYPFIAASRTRSEFLVCDGVNILIVQPDQQPRIQSKPASTAPEAGCEYLAGETMIGARAGATKLGLLRLDNGVLSDAIELSFPAGDDAATKRPQVAGDPVEDDSLVDEKLSLVDEGQAVQALLEYVVTPDGSAIFGRANHGSFAGGPLPKTSSTLPPLFSTTPVPQIRVSVVWGSSNGKWIAGVAEDEGFYAWPNSRSTEGELHRQILRPSRSSQEFPLFSVRERTEQALVSNGRGVLLSVDLADSAAQPIPVSRIGGRSFRLAVLADGSGWQATSTAEVQLIAADGGVIASNTILDELGDTARSPDGSVFWAGTDTRLIRFRKVIRVLGVPLWSQEWPRTKASVASTWGYTGEDGDRHRPSGN